MFKVGERVVCVGSGYWGGLLSSSRAPNAPITGGIYTVRWAGYYDELACIRLEELVNPVYQWRSGLAECAFVVQNRNGQVNFRPVVTRKTDISIFTKLLTPNKETV